MCALTSAHAERRIALVIGNDQYPNLGAHQQLQKAVGDARAVGAALRQINFDVVEGENLGRQALIDRLDDVTRQASGATVFFFFSGHGVALDGANYILPADVPDVRAGQSTRLKGAAISEDYIQSELARSGTQVAVVVLDACRDNPFGESGGKGVGGEKGLVPQEPPRGVFALYAAGRGQKALDRLYDGDSNPNSVFTRALLPVLTKPGVDLGVLAVEVRQEVERLARSVRHEQTPAYYDQTSGGRIFLAASGDVKPAPPPPPPPSPPPPSPQPWPDPQTDRAVDRGRLPGSYWDYEGSLLRLDATPDSRSRVFYVYRPNGAMKAEGAQPGELFFTGQRIGNRYEGTAYAFAGRCGRFAYPVVGNILDDRTIMISGQKPNIDPSSCQRRTPVVTQFELQYRFRVD
jgi:hypothetical protein